MSKTVALLFIIMIAGKAVQTEEPREKVEQEQKESQQSQDNNEKEGGKDASFKEKLADAVIIGGGTTAALTAAASGSLWAAGFGTLGPVAGSIAAGWQATMGGTVLAGSAFSILQSTAMLGLGAVAGPAAVVGAAAGVGYLAYETLKSED